MEIITAVAKNYANNAARAQHAANIECNWLPTRYGLSHR